MGIRANELRNQVIRPVLQRLHRWSPVMENLLMGTAAQASELGHLIKQGRALGLFGIEKETHQDVWDRYLAHHPDDASMVRGFASQREFLAEPELELISNMAYSTAIAWAIYESNEAKYPVEADDLEALALCWYRYYPRQNITESPSDFIERYRTLVKDT
mgnify:CR=1 FL=1